MAEREGRPKGRRTKTQRGTTDPSGAAVPAPRVGRRAGDTAAEEDVDRARHEDAAVPAEVVHLIPAEHLDAVDTIGMSLPVGAGKAVSEVRLPGDTVLTRPDESDIPTAEELDERDSAKAGRRKRTGPRPPAEPREEAEAPAESAPPPTDPGPVDPGPAPTDPEPAPSDPADPTRPSDPANPR